MAYSPALDEASELKQRVCDFWDADPCGTRYLEGKHEFASHARARYALEPHIPDFAQFARSRGQRVLEIGVGMGADYLEWLKAGAQASGVDLSTSSIGRARQRCELAGYTSDLRRADAERLPFPDATFDLVYSYGVMHHSPDTLRCLGEASRVLKPGGEARLMMYHHRSLTGAMLWLRYGLIAGKSLRQSVYDHLESPGTKSYTREEVRSMMTASGFEAIGLRQTFSPGDLLLHTPSAKFQSHFYRMVWKLYPRELLRRVGPGWGLFLLISARKPLETAPTSGQRP